MAERQATPEEIKIAEEKIARARAAQKIIATYDTARVNRLCQAVAAAVVDMKVWGPICDEAVEETRLGDAVSKRNKRNKIKLILRECLRNPSIGIVEEIPEKGLVKYGKPAGVIASLVPTTNPCLTPAGQVLYAIKCRDTIVFSPHPRAKNVTNKTINLIRDVLVREGAPADIIQGIEKPSIPQGAEIMKRADLIIATGGRSMVKAAYSQGVPAYGSGAGNATVIIDDTCDTPERQKEAAENTRISKCSDYGSGCSCDGNLVISDKVYDGFVKALVEQGAYLANEEEAEKIKKVMWDETGHRLPNTVAISPQALALAAGFEIPADRKFIAVTDGGIEHVGKQFFFSSEKLTTLLTLFKYEGEFENALNMMRALFEVGGKGHSCGIYSFNDDHINRLGLAAPVSRIMVRQPNNRGNSGSAWNGMPPTSSMGCGTWGGNIVSENVSLKHYMNTTWVSRPLKYDMPSNEELFGEFCKPGMDEE